MLLNKFENWKLAVQEMNATSDELSQNRDECYSWMASKIKASFMRAGIIEPMIHFEDDASEIVCCWNTNDNVIIPVTLILDLHMAFSFDKELNVNGLWKKKLTFYPLVEDD